MTSSQKKETALGKGPRGASRMDFSGKERDKLYISDGGKGFVDVSYLGGVDSPQDGRVAATADLDHDGTLELLVAFRNAPILRIYRSTNAERGNVIGLRVTGGATRGSNADAIGARVTATCGGVPHTRLIQVGTGFATQNSHTITLGVGACDKVDELRVRWQNGRERVFKDKPTNELYTVAEDGPLKHVPGYYARRGGSLAAASAAATPAPSAPAPLGLLAPLGKARAYEGSAGARDWRAQRDLVFVSFWATWCESCKTAQPRLDALAERYEGSVDFVGVTLDPKDDAKAVAAYATKHPTAYPLVSLPPDARAALEERVRPHFRGAAPPLPSALLVDRESGAVLLRTLGAPTVSDMESALARR